MGTENQGLQSSFLNPPIHNMERFVSFSLPEAKTPAPAPKEEPKTIQTVASKIPSGTTLREKNYWHELPATPGQIIDIARRSHILGMPEPQVDNRMEARDMQYSLKGALNLRNAERKLKHKLNTK